MLKIAVYRFLTELITLISGKYYRGYREGSNVVFFIPVNKFRVARRDANMFTDMSAEAIIKGALVWLAVFAFIGGMVAQSSAGVSGRGFVEGMWKGVEWFFIAAVAVLVVVAIIWGTGMMSTAVNSN